MAARREVNLGLLSTAAAAASVGQTSAVRRLNPARCAFRQSREAKVVSRSRRS